jgi:DNA-binding NtrC family response regulator
MAHQILVIDDEPWLTDLSAEALAQAGFEITMANTGEQALAALEAGDFSAVISDIRLPGVDGLRFFQALSERFPWAVKHFGFYTAYDDEVARQFIAARDIPLLRKPCRLRELEDFVIRLINR